MVKQGTEHLFLTSVTDSEGFLECQNSALELNNNVFLISLTEREISTCHHLEHNTWTTSDVGIEA